MNTPEQHITVETIFKMLEAAFDSGYESSIEFKDQEVRRIWSEHFPSHETAAKKETKTAKKKSRATLDTPKKTKKYTIPSVQWSQALYETQNAGVQATNTGESITGYDYGNTTGTFGVDGH